MYTDFNKYGKMGEIGVFYKEYHYTNYSPEATQIISLFVLNNSILQKNGF